MPIRKPAETMTNAENYYILNLLKKENQVDRLLRNYGF